MVKEISVGNGLVAIVDDIDYDILTTHKWHVGKHKSNKIYAMRNAWDSESKKHFPERMHRAILKTMPGTEVDHVNGNGLDNRRCNLRECTHAQNMQNRIKTVGSSKYKGVTWNKQSSLWASSIRHCYKAIFIGYFKNEEDAARAYNVKALELFGEFANINIVE